MIIYSDHKKPIGFTRQARCGCTIQLVIDTEPWRTTIINVLNDYALEAPYAGDSFRMVRDDNKSRWLVKAKSSIEPDLWVDIAEVRENEEGLAIFELLRIRPKYDKRRPSRREKHSN